jgi:CheY-like chemotaxis protein
MKKTDDDYKYNHVMLIDDMDLDNFINEKLIKANYFSKNIYLNTSAKSALEFLNNLTALGDRANSIYPQVIFIDINMPMVDGFQFIEAYKKTFEEQFPKTKLVVLTSSVFQYDRQKAQDISKEIIFLNKPLTKEVLERI